jgi:ElaB/YqjD/DUF883 family membrane-anchored ribosome-binding protein
MESGKQTSEGQSLVGDGLGQARETLEGLRSLVDQASRAVRDLTQASQEWTQIVQERARDMGEQLRDHGERAIAGVSQQAQELRTQGERAMSAVSQQVEHNPLTSLAVAFALGCVVGTLIRRSGD